MPVINLYNSITGNKQPNGAWTYTGSVTPAPPVPSTWNADIDTTGVAADVYEYTYTVTNALNTCSDETIVTVNIASAIPSLGNDCSNAILIDGILADGFNHPLNTQVSFSIPTEVGQCYLEPIVSSYTNPNSWPSGAKVDMWFKCRVSLALNDQFEGHVSVTSQGLTNPLRFPNITMGVCDLVPLFQYAHNPFIDEFNVRTSDFDAANFFTEGEFFVMYFRVAVDPGNWGNFQGVVVATNM